MTCMCCPLSLSLSLSISLVGGDEDVDEEVDEESFGLVEEGEALRAGCLEEEGEECNNPLLVCCLVVVCLVISSLFLVSCFLAFLADQEEELLASLFCFSRAIISLISRNLSSISLFSSSNCCISYLYIHR